jgi:GT2 family glycosyltransferase
LPWIDAKKAMLRAFAGAAPSLFPRAIERYCERAGLGGRLGAVAASEFDAAHYARMANRSFGSREAALYHYLVVGSDEGWEPRIGFSPRYYLQRNPDVRLAGYEPFAHHCRFGRDEGRGGSPQEDGRLDLDPAALSLEEILARSRPPARGGALDVIMPVYGSRSLVLQAIDSVLQAPVAVPFELIVVDDASPDRVLARELEVLANAGLIRLLVNDRNLGFPASANRGFSLHRDRDVVLLNSDTCVFGDWLDRLVTALHTSSDVGTATPLSPAATILSYPITLRDNHMTVVDCAGIDGICRQVGMSPVDIPTAIGFCMAVKRSCLDEIGGFDSERFGQGYGEENDFCLRAAAGGWQHVAATNLMVWHRGGGSFQAARDELIGRAQSVLHHLHPTYHSTIEAFIISDPLREVRSTLDVARVAQDPRAKNLVLGAAGEGTCREGLNVHLVPEIGPFLGQWRIAVPAVAPLPNLPRLHDGIAPEALAAVVDDLHIRSVRICTKAGSPSVLEQRLVRQAMDRGIPVAVDGPKGVFSAAVF